MRRAAAGLILATLAATNAQAQNRDTVACGTFKAEVWREGPSTHWSVTRGQDKTTETGVLRGAPRFECLDNAALLVEVTFSTGSGAFTAYFPDGSDVAYGRSQIDRRGNRYVLPIQAKSHVPDAFRAGFDYHCKMDMPLNPIPAGSRGDCVF